MKISLNDLVELSINGNKYKYLLTEDSREGFKSIKPQTRLGATLLSGNYEIGDIIQLDGLKVKYVLKNVSPNPDRLRKEKIAHTLQQRGIQTLIHFTRAENLSSILKKGIVPVGLHSKLGITSICNDEMRLDNRLDCSSFSISFPNYQLFFKFRQVQGSNWIVLLVNPEVLLSNKNSSFFFPQNAAKYGRLKNNTDFEKAEALTAMFSERYDDSTRVIERRNLNISDSYTTNPQAEILIKGIIGPKYITGVCFEKERDKLNWLNQNSKSLINIFNYQVHPSLFTYRKDYEHWSKEC